MEAIKSGIDASVYATKILFNLLFTCFVILILVRTLLLSTKMIDINITPFVSLISVVAVVVFIINFTRRFIRGEAVQLEQV